METQRMFAKPADIVVADDDRAMLRFMASVLQSAGYRVWCAEDGQAALELCRRHRPQVVITDWEMPGLSGLELCRSLRLDPPSPETFILLFTVRTRPEDVLQAVESGADDFLTKPAARGELLARLRNALRVLDLQRELREAREDAAGALDALASRAVELVATRDVTVFALAKLAESRDPETGEHLERLRCYSQILAEELHDRGTFGDEIDDRFLQDLYRSSPLHDIGKVGIPDAILRKPGKLTADEFEIMKRHAEIGADALEDTIRHSGCGGFLSMAVDIARYHHERFDGTGYLCGLQGNQIPLAARIVALADVYDALTSARVYKEAYQPAVAREMILSQSGRHFDPAVAAAFEERFEEFQHVREAIERRAQVGEESKTLAASS